jgi:hypothetical protein
MEADRTKPLAALNKPALVIEDAERRNKDSRSRKAADT